MWGNHNEDTHQNLRNTVTSSRLTIIPAGILILSLLVSGCLSGNGERDGHGSGLFTPEGTIRLYAEEQPPYNYITSQGTVSGSSTEIISEIANRTRDPITITLVTWEKGISTVSQEPGTGLFSTVRTPEREPQFRWVGPISSVELVLYGRKDFSGMVVSMDDLRDVGPIAVVRNDVRADALRDGGVTNVLVFPDDYACIRALMNQEAELWFGTSDILTQSAKSLETDPDQFKKVWVYQKSDLFIAFNPGTPDDLIRRWQETLDDMKEDGTFEMISERYMPFVCSWVRCIP